MYDIAIIGAGPAGATLARLIGKRFKVLLVDKRSLGTLEHDGNSAKCCGGLLAPDAQRMLSKFGLGLPMSVLEEPQLFVVKAIDMNSGLEQFYQRHYINMHRGRFDNWLVSLIPDAVDIRTNCRLVSFTIGKESYNLRIKHSGRLFDEQAKVLVAAGGATSFLQNASKSPSTEIKSYIAVQEWVESAQHQPHFTSVFDAELTDFYCWTIPKGQALIVGAALSPDGTAREKFNLYKSKLQQYGFELGKVLRREGAVIIRPSDIRQLRMAEMRKAFIGEAGGWISPSSAEGLSYAFRSAFLLAESLSKGLTGFEKRYNASMKSLRRNIMLKNFKSIVIFNPTLRAAVMHCGLQAVRMAGTHE